MWGDFTGKRLQKFQQVGALLFGQLQRMDQWVLVGVGIAAPHIKVNHVFQRFQAAVMHVRRRQSNIAETGGLESAFICVCMRQQVAAQVLVVSLRVCAHTGIVKLAIGEQSKSLLFRNGRRCNEALLFPISSTVLRKWKLRITIINPLAGAAIPFILRPKNLQAALGGGCESALMSAIVDSVKG